ncbi:hypothetical protein NP493_142g02023 [Ridgeia piscesae]|uniref:Uncharacterized protein n=1 Tax=Ridgeia piscesae TaxID=27915 RepID=A0AAD9P4U0_RIDPI|nr:hypothetical protein NP493_142g02023 [Ridgeia piscesae]
MQCRTRFLCFNAHMCQHITWLYIFTAQHETVEALSHNRCRFPPMHHEFLSSLKIYAHILLYADVIFTDLRITDTRHDSAGRYSFLYVSGRRSPDRCEFACACVCLCAISVLLTSSKL